MPQHPSLCSDKGQDDGNGGNIIMLQEGEKVFVLLLFVGCPSPLGACWDPMDPFPVFPVPQNSEENANATHFQFCY